MQTSLMPIKVFHHSSRSSCTSNQCKEVNPSKRFQSYHCSSYEFSTCFKLMSTIHCKLHYFHIIIPSMKELIFPLLFTPLYPTKAAFTNGTFFAHCYLVPVGPSTVTPLEQNKRVQTAIPQHLRQSCMSKRCRKQTVPFP